MPDKLPINLHDLLHRCRVEGERTEYKASWSSDATIRTLCAIANDFENLGGGFVVHSRSGERSVTRQIAEALAYDIQKELYPRRVFFIFSLWLQIIAGRS